MKEQWRQQMQQKMADYQQPAPEVSWEMLDKALAANKPKAKVVPMWMHRLAAAVVVGIVVVSAGYLVLRQQDEDTMAIVSQQKTDILPSTETAEEAAEDVVATVKTNSTNQEALLTAHTPILRTQDVQEAEESATEQVEESTVSEPTQQTTPSTTATTQKESSPTKSHSATVIYPSDFQYKKTTTSVTASRLMAKAYLSNSMTGGANAMSLSTAISYGENGGPDTNNPKEDTNSPLNPPTPIIQEKEERVSHRQPIRFGLTLCYRLNDQWSIESGLVYSRLSSDYTYLLGGVAYAHGEQKLNYLGIPLKVNHQLWNNRHFGVYVAAGGMMEKMIKGTHQTTENGQEQTTDVSIRPLQFSVNGAIGMEYHLTNLMSIYAEPGVGYYFDNGSDVPTYYQEKPFSFNLNVGLRFSIK
jgi:hypothetical protein